MSRKVAASEWMRTGGPRGGGTWWFLGALVASLQSCTGPTPCSSDANCPKGQWCDLSLRLCVTYAPPDAGCQENCPDGGVEDGGHDDIDPDDGGPKPECTGGDRCAGNTPETCVDGGWATQSACGGAAPVCSNGICGTYRVTGGIRSVGPLPDGGLIRLVSGGLEVGPRTCASNNICVTGGIVP